MAPAHAKHIVILKLLSTHLRQGSGLAHAHLPAFLHPTARSHNKPLTLQSETLLSLDGSEHLQACDSAHLVAILS